ncbi:hypothetical protein [Clostridium oryzae]|uniref:hypothetical protein n=1 Tax=Clostridium oryzae TaxID=1450648 RepID=UPI0009A49D81|nr:hypothetical protein [Clostridium oryzae]
MNKKVAAIDMFINKGMTCKEIAEELHVTVQEINKLLNLTKEYKDYCLRKKSKTEKIKNDILNLYFIEKLKIKAIADINNVSAAYVSKIIKLDSRYEQEKHRRKVVNKDKHERQKRIFNMKKRKKTLIEDNIIFSNLAALQVQNAKAMSTKRKINGDTMIKINLQHYRYNKYKKRLEYDGAAGILPMGISKLRYDKKY